MSLLSASAGSFFIFYDEEYFGIIGNEQRSEFRIRGSGLRVGSLIGSEV